MPTLRRLPGPDDGVQGILHLANLFGDRAVYDFIRWIRHTTGSGDVTEATRQLAVRIFDQFRADNPQLDYSEARRELGRQLGYTPTTLTNFYKLLDASEGRGR